jgi:hypothetical protein
MIVEMLFNNDVQTIFWSNDFTFSKGNECDYVHYYYYYY